ncbi:hypothetical protein HPB50_005225 [Hyalomma asiaticum]|uniref:Uncharacterized protein n=1 Tax=Hyalomma asiaticum TaxID=266040 RepID=A0ACB7SNJ7_HYAAI|nr:hypothetical protein HPB50_005225 [Hyalomma asiaticum]
MQYQIICGIASPQLRRRFTLMGTDFTIQKAIDLAEEEEGVERTLQHFGGMQVDAEPRRVSQDFGRAERRGASRGSRRRPHCPTLLTEFGPTMCGMLASLEEQVQRRPQQAATLYQGRRRTFAEIDRCSARIAEALRAPPDFAEPSDVAACTAAPDDTLLAFLACLRLSACCTPIRPSASSAVLASIMEELPPSCTVVDDETARRFAQARDNRKLNVNDALQFGPTMCGMLASLEEQVQRRPQQAATVFQGRRRTFAEIDRCSARIAEALRAPPDFAEPSDVAACTAAPDDTLLAFLACLRLSACCTPIRSSASSAVLASIMEELPPSCTVVDDETARRFAQARDNRKLNVNDALQPRDDGSGCWDRPFLRRSPSPSGKNSSPRRPLLQILGEDADGRCALGPERCLGRIQWEWRDYPFDRDTVAVLDSVDTARFWEDTLSALSDKRSPSAMLRFLRSVSATRVEMNPDLLYSLLRRAALDPAPVLPELRLVKCSRGMVTTQLVRLFQRILPKARLLRVYERVGRCCAYECPADGELRHFATLHGDFVTIGKPVGDCRASVCDPGLLTECPRVRHDRHSRHSGK